MRSSLAFALTLTLLSSSVAFAQDDSAPPATPSKRPTHIISANVPSNLFGAYSLEYVHAITDHVSIFGEPTFFGPSAIPPMQLKVRGPGVVLGLMIHPFGDAPDGIFVAPEWYVTYIDALEDSDGYKPGMGAGAVAGWTFRFFDYLALSAGLGGTVNLFGTNLAGGYGFGLLPVLRLNLGVAL